MPRINIRFDDKDYNILMSVGMGNAAEGLRRMYLTALRHMTPADMPEYKPSEVLFEEALRRTPSTPASTPQVHNYLAQAAAKTQPPTETPTLTGAAPTSPTSPSERKDHNFAAHIKTRPTLMTEDEASKPGAPIPKWYRHKDANPAKIPAYWPDWIDAPMHLIFLYELVRVDCVKDWRTPSIFLEDVMTAQERLPEDVRDTYVLEKKEFSEPWGPDNFEWDEPLDISSLL